MTIAREIELSVECFCGAVILRVTAPPKRVINCHCNQCRSLNGSVFTTWASFHTDSVNIDTPNNFSNFRVSDFGTRYFCKNCGTHIFSVDKRCDSVVGIPVGVIKGSVPIPSGHYFVSDKAPWYSINDDLPQYGGDSGFVPIQNCETN